MGSFAYKIKERLAVIGDNDMKPLELNLISYNGREAKYDLRRWDRSGNESKMLKGLTLTGQELMELKTVLGKINIAEDSYGEGEYF
ncbi:MAG: hypothetical protein IJ849_12215 [Selenomonadaceae bacterium]|nr:hypothetical protein [Selenomonadaceae bacterium]